MSIKEGKGRGKKLGKKRGITGLKVKKGEVRVGKRVHLGRGKRGGEE